MNWQDVKDFTYNSLQRIKNFFRVMVAAVRGRELSRIDDDATSYVAINDEKLKPNVNVTEARFNEIEADVALKQGQFSAYLKKPATERNDFVAVELGLSLQETLRSAISICRELLKSHANADITEHLYEFEALYTKVNKILEIWAPKAKQEALAYLRELFDNDFINNALNESSQYSQNYINNIRDIEDHLDSVDEMDEREWLQMFGNHVAVVVYSAFYEYSKTYKSDVINLHHDRVLSESKVNIELRQDLLHLLSAINNLLFTYAIDPQYKHVNITIPTPPVATDAPLQDMATDVPVQGTIQELSEHFNGWLKAYNNSNMKAKPVAAKEVQITPKKQDKPKKAVRFAPDAEVQKLFVDDEDGTNLGQSFGTVKVKFDSNNNLPSLKGLINKATSRQRRGSTVVTNKKQPPTHGI